MFSRDNLKLYAITDSAWLNGASLAEQVESAILGGATIVQLREKNNSYEATKKVALEVQAVCKKYNIPFIINDDVELAKEIDADGVHVGQSDASVKSARALLGENKIIGATAKTIEQAKLAAEEGADYLGSGAVFGSSTKKDAIPMSMELLEDICQSVDIPVVAIGGIDASNIMKLDGISIAGVAVVSGLFAQPNIRKAAEEFSDMLSQMGV